MFPPNFSVSNSSGNLTITYVTAPTRIAVFGGTAATTPTPDWINATTIAGVDPTGATDSAAGLQTWSTANGTAAATLYFPAGTYYFNSATGPNGTEECVRFSGANVSIVGDGGGRTIFTDNATPVCLSDIGWGEGTTTNYSYETDTGYAVTASTAVVGTTYVTLTTAAQASNFPLGQYVFVRGAVCSFCGGGQYYGELNQVAIAGNTGTGVVGLAWPLSQDFSQQAGVQLNVVSSSEIIKDVSVSGITWNFHDQAFVASQMLRMKIFDNVFTYLGSTPGQEMSQLNQHRSTEFFRNTVNIPGGIALDMERNPTDWKVHDNTLNGGSGALAGEAGAKISVHGNTIQCTGTSYLACVSVNTYNNLIDHNQVTFYYTGSGPGAAIADSDEGGNISTNTLISNNLITSGGSGAAAAPAEDLQSSSSTSANNIVVSKYRGISLNVNKGAGGIKSYNDTVTITSNADVGCLLIQGAYTHAVVVDGLTCSSLAGPSTTGTASSGSTALTVASGTGTANGYAVYGAGIPPNTTIASGGGTTSITLSQNTTAALSTTPVSFVVLVAPTAIWIADNGQQTGPTQATLTNITGTNLAAGIKIVNNAHDYPNIGALTFNNVTTQFTTYPGLSAAGTSGGAYCSASTSGVLKTLSCVLSGYAQTGSAQTIAYSNFFSTGFVYNPALTIAGGPTGCGTYAPTAGSTTVLTLPANAAMTAENCNFLVTGQ